MADRSVSQSLSADTASVSIRESTDVSEHAGQFSGWNLRMDQVSSGRFTGRLMTIRLPSLEILRETTKQALIKQGGAWGDALVFSVPLSASSAAHLNGRPLVFPNVLINNGTDLPSLVTPRELEVVSIAVSREQLSLSLEALGERRAADFIAGYSQRHPAFSVVPCGLISLQQGFREMCEEGGRLRSALGFTRARESLEETVIDAIATILSQNTLTNVYNATAQKRLVDRIRDYSLAHVEDPPRIADLCRHVGVSRRTLQECFRDAVGLTPLRYLRMLRLNAVHRELRALASAGQQISIGDVAARWGFWHWSRFSGNYRRLFGERPSETLQRVL